jgi:hypothetical protein
VKDHFGTEPGHGPGNSSQVEDITDDRLGAELTQQADLAG